MTPGSGRPAPRRGDASGREAAPVAIPGTGEEVQRDEPAGTNFCSRCP